MPEHVTPHPENEKPKRKNRKKNERKFDMADADYLTFARAKHKHFTEHLADFTPFDNDLNAAYAANWFAKIEFCDALWPDTSTMHEMAGYKVALDNKITELIDKISVIEFYAEKAFKDDTEVLYEFQFNKVNRLAQYNVNFIINAHVIKLLAEDDYNAELLAAGMPPTAVTELDIVVGEAGACEIQHEKFKRTRIKRTRIRIKEMNKLFDMTEAVRKAANIIFAKKPEVAGLFG